MPLYICVSDIIYAQLLNWYFASYLYGLYSSKLALTGISLLIKILGTHTIFLVVIFTTSSKTREHCKQNST